MEHEDALWASLHAVYGLRQSDHGLRVLELAGRVAHLPPGCALWRATGGPLAWTDETHMLSRVDYGVRVLAWMKTEDGQKGRNAPKPEEPPTVAGEVRAEEERMNARAEAWTARQARMKAEHTVRDPV
ncbi:DUF5361 domain-containing protein [Microbacterium oxydans]|uniref:DUF5361 domain-containing protein n=1 Tax=Microbacterium oxydans TaxID=82380 RepID=UPI003B9715EF